MRMRTLSVLLVFLLLAQSTFRVSRLVMVLGTGTAGVSTISDGKDPSRALIT